MFDFDGFDVEEWMIIGPLSDELADEERELLRGEEELNQDDED